MSLIKRKEYVTGLRAQVGEMGAEVERLGKLVDATAPCSQCGVVMLVEKMEAPRRSVSYSWHTGLPAVLVTDQYMCLSCSERKKALEAREAKLEAHDKAVQRERDLRARAALRATARAIVDAEEGETEQNETESK